MLQRIVLSLLFVCAVGTFAQDFRATIAGRVYDPSSAPIGKVPIEVMNVDTNEIARATTDDSGGYTVPFLKPGRYRLSVEAPGFKKLIRDNVVLSVGQSAGIDLQLEVGQLSESVTVSAAAAVLDTENPSRGLVIDQKQVSELPLNARNPFMLSNLTAGVNFNGNQVYQRPFDNGAIADWSVSGGLGRKNEFLLDGAPNNGQLGENNLAYVPPVDAVSEFKIQTNSYDAQYGKTSGGIVNVLTKSGTNEVHGTAYEFLRRNFLDANSFQNNARGLPKSGHFLDQYGGSVGAPVYIPKVYDGRNRSFFFVNYEGYREGTPTPLTLSVPQPEFASGDFSRLVNAQGQRITIYDPATGVQGPNGSWVRQPFANNIIPANRLNPVAQRILSYYRAPNQTTPGSNYSQNNLVVPGGENISADDFYNLVIRGDQSIGEKHHLFFRYGRNNRTEARSTNGLYGVPGEDSQNPLQRINDAYALDWVASFSPTFLFNSRLSFGRYVEGSAGVGNLGFSPTQFGFSPGLINQIPAPDTFGRYEFTNYASLGRFSNYNYTNTWALQNTATKIIGSHSVKIGADLRWIRYNIQNQGNPFRFTSNPVFTQQNFANADPLSGNTIASFLLGAPSGGNVDINPFTANQGRYFAPYVQDDWKVSRRLTLNIGFRWDFNVPVTERYNRLNRGFDATGLSPLNASINRAAFPNFPTLRGGLTFVEPGQTAARLDLTALQPRIGAAFQLTPKIVLRGGFGRYYMNPNNDAIRNIGFQRTTNIVASQDGNRTPVPNLLSNPYPSGVLQPVGSSLGLGTFAGLSPDFFNPNFKVPYSDSFSFGIQYQLPLSSRIEVSYVGNRGYKLQTLAAYNEPSLALRQQCNIYEGGTPSFCDQLLPNPFFGLPQFAGTTRGQSQTLSRWELSRPYPQFGAFNQRGRNDGHLWYNAFQVDYSIRNQKGLSVTFAYTLSKAMTQGAQAINGNDANPQSAFNDIQLSKLERSLAPYDRPHSFKISTIYELPFGRGKTFLGNSSGFVNKLVSGWQHTMLFQYASGRPWDLTNTTTNVRYLREAGLDPDWKAGVVQGARPCVSRVQDNGTTTLQAFSQSVPGCSVDTANFVVLPRYAPRETPLRDGRLRIDAQPQFDMSVNKTTQITERIGVQFRAEAFNVFNRYWMPLQQFNNDPNNAQFGQLIKSAVDYGNANFPRQVQLAVKIIF